MIHFIKNRQITSKEKVFVYYNLHKHVFSIKALEGTFKNKVVGYAEEIYLTDCVFKVSEKGNERVRTNKQKNVHAGVIGYIDFSKEKKKNQFINAITYDPYKYKTFIHEENKKPVYEARGVKLSEKRAYI